MRRQELHVCLVSLVIDSNKRCTVVSFVGHSADVDVQEADKQRAGSTARMNMLEDLLPLIDNFEMAGKSVKTSTEGEEKIYNSYQNLYRQMVEIFRGLGLEAVPTTGEQFDPEIHDGVMREENDDVTDGEVLEEFRKGFKYRDSLLRPAMVKVAVSNKPAAEAEKKKTEDAPTDADTSSGASSGSSE